MAIDIQSPLLFAAETRRTQRQAVPCVPCASAAKGDLPFSGLYRARLLLPDSVRFFTADSATKNDAFSDIALIGASA